MAQRVGADLSRREGRSTAQPVGRCIRSDAMSLRGQTRSVCFSDETRGAEMLTYLEIVRTMQDSGADYAWMGMNAAGAYGATSGSLDFDFFVRPDPLHLDKARKEFRKLGMSELKPKVASGNLIAAGATATFSDPSGGPSVDLMTNISGPSFEDVWSQHRFIEFSGVRVRIASLEHIIASKKAANREKDRYALKRLKDELGWEIKESKRRYRAQKKKRP